MGSAACHVLIKRVVEIALLYIIRIVIQVLRVVPCRWLIGWFRGWFRIRNRFRRWYRYGFGRRIDCAGSRFILLGILIISIVDACREKSLYAILFDV